MLLIEMVIPNDNSPFLGKFLDIDMMMFLHGRERSEGEYRALLASVGLRVARIVPTPSLHSVIEAMCV